jgi:hypothetical protein
MSSVVNHHGCHLVRLLGLTVCGWLAQSCGSAQGPDQPAITEDKEAVHISIDYAQEKGTFSKYLFMANAAPDDEQDTGFQLAKQAGLHVLSLGVPTRSDDPFVANFARQGMEGLGMLQLESYIGSSELTKALETWLDMYEAAQKANPGLVVKNFQFGNEPEDKNFWNGTREQFFESFEIFARAVKARNKDYAVGGPGFALSPHWGKTSYPMAKEGTEWVNAFVKYMSEHQVPLDFVSFHGYSSEIRTVYVAPIQYLTQLFEKYPGLSPLFGTPRIGNTEWDMNTGGVDPQSYRKQMDTAWRAAHNILGLSAMADAGLWIADEFGGPFRNLRAEDEAKCDFTWVKNDKTLKPIYYGHQAFNQLWDTTRLVTQGANFETFGAIAGRSADGSSVTVLLSNYDERELLKLYPPVSPPAGMSPVPRQSENLATYPRYQLRITNLPWPDGTRVKVERSLVDEKHQLEVVESTEITGGSTIELTRETTLPEVQLIQLTKL